MKLNIVISMDVIDQNNAESIAAAIIAVLPDGAIHNEHITDGLNQDRVNIILGILKNRGNDNVF